MDEKLKNLLELQNQLNLKIDENWFENRTLDQLKTAIWLECAELVESTPWKWWKHGELDEGNVKIETVDIFHFYLSYLLLFYSGNINQILGSVELFNFQQGLKQDFSTVKNFKPVKEVLQKADRETRILKLTENIVYFTFKKMIFMVSFFLGWLISEVFGDFEQFYEYYLEKNKLNHKRQELGYRTGEYQKVVDGVEDNQKIIEKLEN